jgi:hypothetical protein
MRGLRPLQFYLPALLWPPLGSVCIAQDRPVLGLVFAPFDDLLGLYLVFKIATITAIQINAWPIARHAAEGGCSFMENPAMWTIALQARNRNKSARTVEREVRRIKFFLYLTLARLYFAKFRLKLRGFATIGIGKVVQIFG